MYCTPPLIGTVQYTFGFQTKKRNRISIGNTAASKRTSWTATIRQQYCNSTKAFGYHLSSINREEINRLIKYVKGDGDKGLDVLLARLKAGKHSCENLLNMFVARADMEEEYARKLGKLSKEEFGKEEEGYKVYSKKKDQVYLPD